MKIRTACVLHTGEWEGRIGRQCPSFQMVGKKPWTSLIGSSTLSRGVGVLMNFNISNALRHFRDRENAWAGSRTTNTITMKKFVNPHGQICIGDDLTIPQPNPRTLTQWSANPKVMKRWWSNLNQIKPIAEKMSMERSPSRVSWKCCRQGSW